MNPVIGGVVTDFVGPQLGIPQLPTMAEATNGLVALAVGSILVPAAAGIAAARYGRFSPGKAALVSVGVSIVGALATAAVASGIVSMQE